MDKKYIWQEIQENGFERTFFCPERDFPSLIEEISGYDSEGKTKVNLKLRFPHLLDITAKTDKEECFDDTVMRGWEFDLYLHFIAALDLYSGYNRNNKELDSIYQEIICGKFGDKIKALFCSVSLKEQDIVLRNFCNFNIDNLEMFYRTYKEIYPSGLIYKKDSFIIVYLDRKESDDVRRCMELLRLLFLPVSYSLKIHFRNHIGIIGIEDTMKIGKIRII